MTKAVQSGKRGDDSPVHSRSVARVVTAMHAIEGEGFEVRRPFPSGAARELDPFLLLDHFGPKDVLPGEAKGAPDHPHRGFETVTYLIEGAWEHRDSQGNHGHLGPGDVQWMTAGSGVIHSEMPSKELSAKGGRMHGFQLWVNLPKKDKMMRPRYQDVPAMEIPIAASPDGKVRVKVIAGESLGAKAVIDTRTPIIYLHFTVQPGGSIEQPVPRSYNAFAYVVAGAGSFGPVRKTGMEGRMVVFGNDGDTVSLVNPGDSGAPMDVLLIAGQPLGEPVARYGPFVMNTAKEIEQAIEDFHEGRFGTIKAAVRDPSALSR